MGMSWSFALVMEADWSEGVKRRARCGWIPGHHSFDPEIQTVTLWQARGSPTMALVERS
eukprot:CAMPEP_0115545004 /NCGR_PEP_ID=MMETSP0271-20121206/92383_1 /TAXON_ID=71861 /ORGANISM="Scrippsiella trochoidea, Strain CCMP3099" /LENGTH=58 /DNA_ID=CAMNT_0002978343 /DNA_START=126 /DNA_END=298 /DNA_ORIENTATION=-